MTIKYTALIISAAFLYLAACNHPASELAAWKVRTDSLQHMVDSMQQRLSHVYTPGLGEFMSGIQVHHEKLWFAGKAENWKLADFEIGEIRESLEDIQKFCTDRPEVKSLPMILPVVDSLDKAIAGKDLPRFKTAFALLTTTCNNCHQVTRHEFNVIRQPETPPFSNQVFANQAK